MDVLFLFIFDEHFQKLISLFLAPCSIGGGTLAEYVASHGSLTEYTTTRLLRKLLEGMQYLHEAKIIHVNLTVSKWVELIRERSCIRWNFVMYF